MFCSFLMYLEYSILQQFPAVPSFSPFCNGCAVLSVQTANFATVIDLYDFNPVGIVRPFVLLAESNISLIQRNRLFLALCANASSVVPW